MSGSSERSASVAGRARAASADAGHVAPQRPASGISRAAPDRAPDEKPSVTRVVTRAPSPHGTPSATERVGSGSPRRSDPAVGEAAIRRCVREELERYLALLDGEPPDDLYRQVMRQVESALLDTVLEACDGNRSRTALWLGIGRGTLRGKLADLDRD